MKIELEVAKKITRIIGAFASQQTTFPASCLFDAAPGGDHVKINLRNDGGSTFEMSIPATDIDEGMYHVVTARSISTWFSRCRHPQSIVKLSHNGTRILLQDGRSKQYLKVLASATAFPERAAPKQVTTMNAEEVMAILAEIGYTIDGLTGSNLMATGAILQFDEGRLLCQAMTNERGVYLIRNNLKLKERYATIVSRSELKLLRTSLMALASLTDVEAADIEVGISKIPSSSDYHVTRFSLHVNGVNVVYDMAPLALNPWVRDEFARLEQHMTSLGAAKMVVVEKKELQSQLRRLVSDASGTYYTSVLVRIDEGDLMFSSRTLNEDMSIDLDVPIVESSIPDGQEKDFRFKIALNYLKDVVSAMPGTSIMFTYTDISVPLVVTSDLSLGRHYVGLRL